MDNKIKDHITGLFYSQLFSGISSDDLINIISSFENHNFNDGFINFNEKTLKLKLKYNSNLGILNIYNFVNTKTIYPNFFKTIRLYYNNDVELIFRNWILCLAIQYILFSKITDITNLILDLKLYIFKIIKIILPTLSGKISLKDAIKIFNEKDTEFSEIIWSIDFISKYENMKKENSQIGEISFEKIYKEKKNASAIIGLYLGYDKIKDIVNRNNKLDEKLNELFKQMKI